MLHLETEGVVESTPIAPNFAAFLARLEEGEASDFDPRSEPFPQSPLRRWYEFWRR